MFSIDITSVNNEVLLYVVIIVTVEMVNYVTNRYFYCH